MDGAAPEADRLIAMSKPFGVSLNDLLEMAEPEIVEHPAPLESQ